MRMARSDKSERMVVQGRGFNMEVIDSSEQGVSLPPPLQVRGVQLAMIKRYARIGYMRDHEGNPEGFEQLWREVFQENGMEKPPQQ